MHINAFNLLLIDLLLFDIHQHGNEGRLSEKYAAAMQNLSSDDIRWVHLVSYIFNVENSQNSHSSWLSPAIYCRYIHFDFHQICGHIHFDRLSILYDQIADNLKKHGYASIHPRMPIKNQIMPIAFYISGVLFTVSIEELAWV